MTISLIAAMAENRVIGRDNALPWRLPRDLRRFKRLTQGHTVIMGRRTFQSVEGGALPNRRSIVVTRDRSYQAPGAETAGSLREALDMAGERADDEVFILGGAEIFELALPRADRIYLTIVHAKPAGDTYFPEFDPAAWTLVEEERHEADERNAHAMSFRVYEKRRG